MNRKYLCFLSGFVMALLNSFTANAQSQLSKTDSAEVIKKVLESSEKVNTVVYKIDHKKKGLSEKDTTYTTAICSLYIAPKDRLKAYHIVDKEYSSSYGKGFAYMRYDGKRAFYLSKLIDSLDVYRESYIAKGKRKLEQIVHNYNFLLLGKHFAFSRKSSGKGDSQGANVLITEEMINNKTVYCITVNFKDNEDARNRVEKLYIGKSDYLPTGGSSFWQWENMEEYEYYEVEYLAINPEISLEEFKVDKNLTVNLAERYKVFKEKINNKESIN
ncbi:hypothetical protein ABS768_15200 [Flavobacterium sp. ST-75]|uniref:Uncharacterized protein n=1 Tax=Flavobacterium rhizophilum TaxID=3163296 RepID=A0ABW8YF81_9FLAO